MATNLQLDDALIQQAVRLGGHRTKKSAVTQALLDYVRHMEQAQILDLFGTIEYDETYDYKRQRAKQ